MNQRIKKIIIATGGTGGHIFPATSLANHLKDNNIKVEIISDRRGLRYLKNFQDLKITVINSSTFFKKNLFFKFVSLLSISYSIFRSVIFLILNRPNLIFGMGGYASFPVCVASILLRIPLILYENNLYIGKTNKYLIPFAKKVLVSFKELEGVPRKHQKKIHEVGNIIRKEIINFKDKKNITKDYEKLKILILGGSQAAKIFAEKLPYIFKKDLFPMNKDVLKNKLKKSIIVEGDVKNTTKDFFEKYNPAPIAFIINDLDYYSSTINSFNIFYGDSKFYLPRIFCYFDDVLGDEISMYSDHSGELLAISEFNETNKNKKILLNKNLVSSSKNHWRYQIYYYHDFLHPEYNNYVETDNQEDKGTFFHG